LFANEENESERVMASSRIGLMGGVVTLALGAVLAVGCSDDGDRPDGNGGEAGDDGNGGKAGGGTGGKGGSAGSSNNGGKAGGGSGGTDGGTGNSDPVGGDGGTGNPDPMGGTGGGGDVDPPIGGGGAGGEGGGGEQTFAPITKLVDEIYTQASDLRGLRFSTESEGKLWAVGHKGIIPSNPSVIGDPDKELVIARFKADGTPDETFSGDGFLEVNLVLRVEGDDPNTVETTVVVLNDGNEEALGVVELEGGDIVVSGNKRDAAGKGMDAYLARFTPAGEPVGTFGVAGVATVTFGWGLADVWPPTITSPAAPSDNSWGVELDSTGAEEKLVVFGAGTAAKVTTGTQRTDTDRYVTRVLASTGAIDPGFNGGAPFTYNTGGTNNDNGRRGIVEADGSILAGGYTDLPPYRNSIVAIKLKADGTRDAAFGPMAGNPGVFVSNPVVNDGGAAECYAIARQSSGRIVTTGYGSATGTNLPSSFGYASTKAPDLVSFGYSADGKTLDGDWGNQGMFIAQSEELSVERFEERGRDIAALSDDRLVYAGNFATDPAIYVVNPDGSFDPDTEIGALFRYTPLAVTINPTTQAVSTSHFYRVVVSPDGKRIAATTNQNRDGVLLALLKVGE
jgi:uncharacterized delta-60 repeat protein